MMLTKMKKEWGIYLLIALFAAACSTDPQPQASTKPTTRKRVNVPKFERDSAYAYVERQVDFGPRAPNSTAHQECKNWMANTLRRFGATVIEQDFKATAYTGEKLNGTNVIGSYNPEHPRRVLLAAHWDSRPIADYDPDEAYQKQPVPGADDGASGVGVLLEVARLLQQNPIDLGVDIIFFDLEDYGESQSEDFETWCLGSQYWGKNPHKKGYQARFGILLDMVGAKNARFTKEETSMAYAPAIMNKVWKLGQNMGYGNFFVDDKTKLLIDDHLFVNRLTGIPTIDIINRPVGTATGFGHYWHTHKDDMDVIDKRTLRAVGQTVLAVLFRESEGTF
ncbi:MAG: M28 family peptidase [Bacteroidota bacterium]